MGEEFRRTYRVAEEGIGNVGVVLCGGNVDVGKVVGLMEKERRGGSK